MTHNKSSKLGLGLVIGSIIGGVAAFFLSPKSGKENRELVSKQIHELKKMIEEKQIQARVKEIYGEVTDEGIKIYTMAKDELNKNLDEMKERMDEIDVNRYKALVDDVIARVKEETEESTEGLAKLKEYFMSRWSQAEPVQEVKEAVKKHSKRKDANSEA